MEEGGEKLAFRGGKKSLESLTLKENELSSTIDRYKATLLTIWNESTKYRLMQKREPFLAQWPHYLGWARVPIWMGQDSDYRLTHRNLH